MPDFCFQHLPGPLHQDSVSLQRFYQLKNTADIVNARAARLFEIIAAHQGAAAVVGE